MLSRLADLAAGAPSQTALAAPQRQPLPYKDLLDQLRSAGESFEPLAGTFSVTALAVAQGPESISASLAILGSSACAPLDVNLTQEEYLSYLKQLRPLNLVFGLGAEAAARAAQSLGIGLIELRCSGAVAGIFEWRRVEAPARSHRPRQSDHAMLLQTSATTGAPKLVARSHAQLLASAMDNIRSTELTALDRYLSLVSLAHAGGLDAAFAQLAAGGSVFCAPSFHPAEFPAWFAEFRPTWLLATPALHRAILAAADRDPELASRAPLRFLRTGAAPADPHLLALLERRFGVPVLEGYGLTEVPTVARNRLSWRKPGSVGLSTGPEIAIHDELGNALPPETEGEVVVRGPTVMCGYVDNPQANVESFRDGWFRTGDTGRLDADGFLYIRGRRKEFINRGARKILPQEVERALARHPAVAEAAAFSVPHRSLGEEVAACVVLRQGAAVDEPELRRFALSELSPFKVPRRIFFSPSLPKTSAGKLKRKELSRLFGAQSESALAQAGPPSPPCELSEQEARLCTIWSEVLGVECASAHQDFFDLGGDSLSLLALLSRVSEAFGASEEQLVLTAFLDQPTVATLARMLSDDPPPRRPEAPLANPAVLFRTTGKRTPLFLFCNEMAEALELRHLSRFLGLEQPFAALCPPPLAENGRLVPVDRLAAQSAASIRALHGSPSCIVAGFCGAAPLAYEAALQLMAQGVDVPLLMLFDAPAPGYPKIRRHAGAYISHAARILRGAAPISLAEVRRHLAKVYRIATRRMHAGLMRPGQDPDSAARSVPIQAISWQYRLRAYPAPIVHFLAEEVQISTRVLSDPRLGWADFASGLKQRSLAVPHLAPFSPQHAETVAAAMTDEIARADGPRRR